MGEIKLRTGAEFKLAQKLRTKLAARQLEIHKASLVIARLVQSATAVDALIDAVTALHKQIRVIDIACDEWLHRSFDDVKHADGDETMDVDRALRNELVEHRRRRNRRPDQEFDNNANPITTPWFETGKPARSEAG